MVSPPLITELQNKDASRQAAAMIDAAASPSSITPYLVWSLVENQAATDTQADLAPSQAAILPCQAAANVLATAGKQATRFKLTAERYYTEHLVMNERIAH